jgi:hypothetical protein
MLVTKQNIASCLFGQSHTDSLYLADIEIFNTPPHSKIGNFSNHFYILLAPIGADSKTLLLLATVL